MEPQIEFRIEEEGPDTKVYPNGKYKNIVEALMKLPVNKWFVVSNVTKRAIKEAVSTSNLAHVTMKKGLFFKYEEHITNGKKEVWVEKLPRSDWNFTRGNLNSKTTHNHNQPKKSD